MSRMGNFYLSIITNAGLDPLKESSWDKLQRVLDSMPSNVTARVDVFDHCVDALLIADPRLITDPAYHAA